MRHPVIKLVIQDFILSQLPASFSLDDIIVYAYKRFNVDLSSPPLKSKLVNEMEKLVSRAKLKPLKTDLFSIIEGSISDSNYTAISKIDLDEFIESCDKADLIAQELANAFCKIDFPNVPLEIESELITVQIVPPYQEEFVETLTDIDSTIEQLKQDFDFSLEGEYHRFRRSRPVIEEIRLHPDLQSKGFLSCFIKHLSELDFIEYICISNIENQRLADSLRHNEKWHEFNWNVLQFYPSFVIAAQDVPLD